MNCKRRDVAIAMFFLAGFVAIGQVACSTRPGEPSTLNVKENAVKLDLGLPKDRFILGEGIDVRVKLTNPGPGSVQTPSFWRVGQAGLTMTLKGPGIGAAGETFTQPAPAGGALKTQVEPLAAGNTRTIEFSLPHYRPLTQPGKYTLAARVDGGTWNAASAEVSFTVESGAIVGAAIAVDVGVSSDRVLRAAFLRESPPGRTLEESFMYEARPDLGEINYKRTRSVGTAGAEAREPFCPWTNYDRASELWSWDGWREGSALLALPGGATQPQRIDLGSRSARLIRPALMSDKGTLDVAIISADGGKLEMIRFRSPDAPQPGPAAVVWSVALPSPAVAARWTLGSIAKGSVRRLVVTTQEKDGLAMHMLDAGDGTKTNPLRTVTLAKAYALREAEPAIRVDDDGATHAAVICALNEERTEFGVVDAVFPADPAAKGTIAATTIKNIGADFARATTAYRVATMGPMTREWLIQFHTGEITFSEAPDARTSLPAPPAFPLQLLRMSETTYVLLIHPKDGVILHSLN